ncbi:hypothetical protein BGZ63DRAFT_9960 [Mariannaea sp. PMI_226]|nr:hypothetical protein BGZ63DRAFT_9960 [Mariannaea sp. PMI_226]
MVFLFLLFIFSGSWFSCFFSSSCSNHVLFLFYAFLFFPLSKIVEHLLGLFYPGGPAYTGILPYIEMVLLLGRRVFFLLYYWSTGTMEGWGGHRNCMLAWLMMESIGKHNRSSTNTKNPFLCSGKTMERKRDYTE